MYTKEYIKVDNNIAKVEDLEIVRIAMLSSGEYKVSVKLKNLNVWYYLSHKRYEKLDSIRAVVKRNLREVYHFHMIDCTNNKEKDSSSVVYFIRYDLLPDYLYFERSGVVRLQFGDFKSDILGRANDFNEYVSKYMGIDPSTILDMEE